MTSGSDKFKIALVGEAWGEVEEQWKKPFVGPAGDELNRMLNDAGLDRSQVHTTNVFNLHPAGDKLESLCGRKSDGGVLSQWPSLVPGLYLKEEYQGEVERLLRELETVKPNLAVLLGNTACWALLEQTSISKIRGTCRYSTRLPTLKCLPTFHPAAVLRQWPLRHTTVLDFAKAKREGEFPEIRRPRRYICIAETLDDIRGFDQSYIRGAKRLAFDIETDRGEQITCISFAPSIDRVLVIPFHDSRKPGGSYWATLGDELGAWSLVADILGGPQEKVAQNGLYDIQYLWMKYGIAVNNVAHDSMLLHHSLHPESEKGLGFLGSIYTDEPAWKADRPRGGDQLKRED